MDTPLPLPDEAAERARKRAAELNMSNAEFVVAALSYYLGYLDSLSLQRDMDEMLARLDAEAA